MPFVFVYGTLMRHGANHHVLRRLGGRFVTTAQTREPRVLVDLGPYPALLPESAAATVPVFGEVWELDPSALEPLDEFEGCPDLYTRERIALVDPAGSEIEAFTYVIAGPLPKAARVIETGRYTAGGTVLPDGAAAYRRPE
jgi:gamma-glutamylcyclotransferase (GGCT)/AIG2-like uncharacterized protein YtfP